MRVSHEHPSRHSQQGLSAVRDPSDRSGVSPEHSLSRGFGYGASVRASW
jgi:hypothetical protein